MQHIKSTKRFHIIISLVEEKFGEDKFQPSSSPLSTVLRPHINVTRQLKHRGYFVVDVLSEYSDTSLVSLNELSRVCVRRF